MSKNYGKIHIPRIKPSHGHSEKAANRTGYLGPKMEELDSLEDQELSWEELYDKETDAIYPEEEED